MPFGLVNAPATFQAMMNTIIRDIAPLASQKAVQHFLGFAGFYRRFIKGYSKICLPLTNSTALKPAEWKATPQILLAQKTLIEAFTSAPVLKHFDPETPAIVETDASDYALGGILSQHHPSSTASSSLNARKLFHPDSSYS